VYYLAFIFLFFRSLIKAIVGKLLAISNKITF
jgi:hypothetical protein